METRRQKIILKYTELSTNIKTLLNKNILPNLDNYDICDLLFLLINHFSDSNLTNYKQKINYIIDLDDNIIIQEERDLIYDIIYEFIIWLQNLK